VSESQIRKFGTETKTVFFLQLLIVQLILNESIKMDVKEKGCEGMELADLG
jgi:hypothetical protein